MIQIPEVLNPLLQELKNREISPIFVGGFVRDSLLGIEVKDIDIELYNVESFDIMSKILEPFGKANLVGKSFGVLKLSYGGYEIDFSLPRIEKKISSGHKGFEVTLDSKLPFKEAAKRRDFTINAMGYDYTSQTLLDPYNGQIDLGAKKLHYVDATTFQEDPLRVFRALQFCARFELTCKIELIHLCKTICERGDLEELPKERVFEEFSKLFLKANKPSIGIKLLYEFSMQKYFPELINVDYQSLDEMSKYKTADSKQNTILMLALLVFHFNSFEEVDSFLEKFVGEKQLKESVLNLYMYRYSLQDLRQKQFKNYDVLLLSTKTVIENLLLLNKARGYDFHEVYEVAKRFNVLTCKPKPLIQGRDLIELGFKPSNEFSKILEIAFDAQLQEEFCNYKEAKMWLQSNIKTLLEQF